MLPESLPAVSSMAGSCRFYNITAGGPVKRLKLQASRGLVLQVSNGPMVRASFAPRPNGVPNHLTETAKLRA